MDPIHQRLVKELVRHLSIELDLHYSNIQLSEDNNGAVRTIQVAAALLIIAGEEVPEIYQHLMSRIALGEQEVNPTTTAD